MGHPLLDIASAQPVEPYLRQIGEVFRVFDRQDSGCVGYGVAVAGQRWFVKTATTAPGAASLRRAVALHGVIRHPLIIPLRHTIAVGDSLALVYPWTDGEVLYHATVGMDRCDPASAMARFRRLPVPRVERVLGQILDAHLAVERAGFVAVDFYDGCVLYDFATGRIGLCDLDEYRPGPFRLDAHRLPGSSRFMAPEEFRRGATIDIRTTVYTLGRTIRLLLDAGDRERVWRGTPAQQAVVDRATRDDPADRYPGVVELAAAWRAATG